MDASLEISVSTPDSSVASLVLTEGLFSNLKMLIMAQNTTIIHG